MTNKLSALVVLLMASIVAATAYAKPSRELDQHIAEGRRLYGERNFDGALGEFDLAYRLDADPRLLLNMGRCHYMAGRPKEALEVYKQVLKQRLTGEQRVDVLNSVTKATIKLAEQQQAAAAQPPSPTPSVDLAPISPTSQSPKPTPLYRKGWFWGIIGGVTAVGLAVGLGLGFGLRSTSGPGPGDVIQ